MDLTPIEKEVVKLVVQAASNREIAARLEVSQQTIEKHVSSMLAKTGTHNRTELARWAIQSGLSN